MRGDLIIKARAFNAKTYKEKDIKGENTYG